MEYAAQSNQNLSSLRPNCCFRHYPQFKYATTSEVFPIATIKITYGNGIPNTIDRKSQYGVSPSVVDHSLLRVGSQEESVKNSPINSKIAKQASNVSQDELFDHVPIQNSHYEFTKSNPKIRVNSECSDSKNDRIKSGSESSPNRDEIISVDPSLNIEEGTGSFNYHLRENSRNNDHFEASGNLLTPTSDNIQHLFKRGNKVYQSQIHKKQAKQSVNTHKKSSDMLLETKKKTEQSFEDEQIRQENENSQIFISKQLTKIDEKSKQLEPLKVELKNVEMAESKYTYGHARHSSNPETSRNQGNNVSELQKYEENPIEDGAGQNSSERSQPLSRTSEKKDSNLKISQIQAYSIHQTPDNDQNLSQNIGPSSAFSEPISIEQASPVLKQSKEQLQTEPYSKQLEAFQSKKKKRIPIFKSISEVQHNFGLSSERVSIKKTEIGDFEWK